MPVTIDKLKIITDERGVIFEPLSADCLADQKNVHVVINQMQKRPPDFSKA
jgi:hypothetical protein